MIPNNMNKKINITFSDFCSAGSSLQFVTTDSQTSYRNYRSDFCPCILLIVYCTKVVCSPPPILTFLSPVRIAVWLKTQGLCNLLQLASNFLVGSARGQTETRASYRYQQLFCCFENGSRRISQQLFCCRNRKLPVRALSYKAVFSIRATKYLSKKSCQCAPSLTPDTY
jgi:hypothetical protein